MRQRVILLLLAAALMALAAESQDRGRRRMMEPSKIKAGEIPPDFDLPHLELVEGKDGKAMGIINEKERFKLSAFQGKRPVCMIMSSYT